MPKIEISTFIKAPKERVFDLARSIDVHMISTKHTNEKAIAGRTSGLIELNETVTWKAKHFGITQTLTTRITEFKYPKYFVDEMVNGAFKSFRHEHLFNEENGGTLMKDSFEFNSPLGLIGKVFNQIILTNYMTNLLIKRNEIIKEIAETDEWKDFLKQN